MKLSFFKMAILILLLQLIFSFYIGLSLPDNVKIPTHWNLHGQIDGWSGKWTGILLFPGINLILILLALFFPVISPRYRNDPPRFQKILPTFISVLVFFFSLIHIYSLLIAKGTFSPRSNFILVILGVLFICIGYLLPKLPANFYMGIRLPWTLSSDSVWRKAHCLGGWSFAAGGIIMMIIGFLKTITLVAQIFLVLALVLVIAFPILGAFIYYKREEG